MKANKDGEGLIEALKLEDWFTRQHAAEALGEIGDARAVEPLIQALKDENATVRANAAEALGKIGDARAVEPLIQALNDEEIRTSAALALGNIGDAKAVESLVQCLSDKQWGIVEVEAVAEALGKIGDARAVEPLIKALTKKDIDVLSDVSPSTAAEALGEIGDARAVEPLIQALSFENSSDRASAAEALGKIGDIRARKPLEQALSDENPHVQRTASKALEKMGYDKRGKDFIKHLLILLEKKPVPEGVDGVISNVLDHAPYRGAGSPVYGAFVDDKTKIKVAVTGPEDYSPAYIIAAAKTHFPKIDMNNLQYQDFWRVDQQGKQSRGIIIHD